MLVPCIYYTCYVGPGIYLGYPNKEKYRVWITDLSQSDLSAAERSSTEYTDLGKKLLQLVFRRELNEPDRFCCTKSEGKELLDQLKLQGIRCKHYMCLLVYEHFLCVKKLCLCCVY